tara:strand:- start:1441 stop:1845 length:405 start_codon:yes stop_codon:yes gene_type:complete
MRWRKKRRKGEIMKNYKSQNFNLFWNEYGSEDGAILIGKGIKFHKEYAAKRYLMESPLYLIDHDYGRTEWLGGHSDMMKQLAQDLNIPAHKTQSCIKFQWLMPDGSVERETGKIHEGFESRTPNPRGEKEASNG